MNRPNDARAASGRAGFTLVEILVVITIIMLLLAVLMVFGKRAIDGARDTKCQALVTLLSEGCQAYHQDFGVYPAAGSSSKLHECLGSRVRKVASYSQSGNNIVVTKDPYVNFRLDMLPEGATTTVPNPPQPVIDAWNREIQYANPGTHNVKGVDIWSKGKSETDETDDITNWKNMN